MREILFRGKRVDNGDWTYGNLIVTERLIGTECYVSSQTGIDNGKSYKFSVNPPTVGQFTGLTDKNGKKIFEGDIVKHESGATVLFHKVVFERRNGCAYFGAVMGEYETWGFCNSFPPTLVEIVGNIHDNPELLEEEEE